MKIPTEVLQTAVKKVYPFVAQKSTIPIYMHFLLDARDGTLVISGSDFEGSCRWDTGIASDSDPLYATVHAKIFHDDILGINESEIDLYAEKNKVVVKTSRHRARIDSLPGDEYLHPALLTGLHEVDGRILDAMERCAIAVKPKKTPAILTGVHLRVANRQIQAFGTDGVRAGKYEVVFDDDAEFQITLPKKMASIIAKNARNDGPLRFWTNESTVAFSTDSAVFTSQLLDGNYPEVWSFFDRDRTGYEQIQVDGSALADALNRAMVFITKSDGYVLFTTTKNALTISATAHDRGVGEVEIDAQCDVETDFALNAQFLYDFVRLLKKEQVILSVRGTLELLYLNGLDNFQYVMMPMYVR